MSKSWSPSDVAILYRDHNFFVVDKPYDLKINGNDSSETTLETLLKKRGLDEDVKADKKMVHSFYYIHRLDYATSGVMFLGLTKYAARSGERAFSQRLVRKYYLALLRGHVNTNNLKAGKQAIELSDMSADMKSVDITASIVRDYATDFPVFYKALDEDCDASKAVVSRTDDQPRSARTTLVVLEYGTYSDSPATKVLLIPRTGRSHQLRVHSKYIGHVIVGDYTYSNRHDRAPYRMMLHSYFMSIPVAPFDSRDLRSADPFSGDANWNVNIKLTDADDVINLK